jgi:hypothetical protein
MSAPVYKYVSWQRLETSIAWIQSNTSAKMMSTQADYASNMCVKEDLATPPTLEVPD